MRRSGRDRRAGGAGAAGSSVLALAAILALLVNQTLLSFTHPVGAPFSSRPEHHASADHRHAEQAADARHENGKEPAGAHHQTCHFCRLLGFALPPPPAALPGRIAVSARPFWVAADRTVAAGSRFRVGHPVRAPPRLA